MTLVEALNAIMGTRKGIRRRSMAPGFWMRPSPEADRWEAICPEDNNWSRFSAVWPSDITATDWEVQS